MWVTTVDDGDPEGDEQVLVTTTATTSGDPGYDGLEVPDVLVTIIDDDL